MNSKYFSTIKFLLFLSLAVLGWYALAPTQIGGQVTYVIVDGNSMEPRFHLGDLVLVRRQPTYQIGDAVTYKNLEIGRFVFHRIVGMQADRFVLQGDHNAWLDSYQPTQNEIIGKLWIHLPGVGKWIEWARQPIGLALLSVVFGGLMVTGMIFEPNQRKQRKNPSRVPSANWLEAGLILSGLAAVAFFALLILTFARPLTRPASNQTYQQTGYFFYSASTTPGVYDSDTIQTGDPIFTKLTCLVKVGMVYNIEGSNLAEIHGSHQLNARISDEQSGWQRTLPLEAETPFSGNSYFSTVNLDLCQIQSLVSAVEQQTGMHSNTYTLEVVNHTTILGKMAERPVLDTFDSNLTFRFDKTHFYLATEAGRGTPIRTAKEGTLPGAGQEANTFTLAGQQVPVATARLLATMGFLLSVIILLTLGWHFFNGAKSDPEKIIRLKYGNLILDAYSMNLHPNLPIIDVASMDDLARLAERHNTMITHIRLNFLHYYLVQSEGAIYRYVTSSGRPGLAEKEAPLPQLYPVNPGNYYLEAQSVTQEPHPSSLMWEELEENPAPASEQTVLLPKLKL
jgi:signal peptidase I